MHVACSIDCSIGIKLLCMQVTENPWNFEVDFVRFKKNKQMNSGATWLAEDQLTGSSNILQNSSETI